MHTQRFTSLDERFMWLTRPSTLFRTDLAFTRFCASPVVAVTSLIAAAAIVVCFNLRPSVEVPMFGWLAAALFPGVWLVTSGFIYLIILITKLSGGLVDGLFAGLEDTWKSVLFRREALALVALLAVIQGTTTWYQHQQFDEGDFRNCVAGLQEPGLERLAGSLTKPMMRKDFRAACWDAYSVRLQEEAKPANADELRKRYLP